MNQQYFSVDASVYECVRKKHGPRHGETVNDFHLPWLHSFTQVHAELTAQRSCCVE